MRGLERGVERVIGNFRTVANVEIEAFIVENLVRQMEQGLLAPSPIWSNLKTFPWEKFHGKVHFIIGGYPCQPFSIAGNQGGINDPRHLWPFIYKGIEAIKPVGCFFENVPGHIAIGYREVRQDLERLGYTVEEGIFSAEEVGAPHQRKRLFILAIRNDQLGNTNSQSDGNYIRKLYTKTSSTGTDLANTESINRGLQLQPGRSQQNKAEPVRGSEEVGNSASEYVQGRNECGQITNRRPGEQWPSRPGEQQYEWEPARVKSRMGFMLNGYSFREDLLRMAGNGVVEQTAELVFRTLLNKFS